MEFPQFMICSKLGYKADALTELGLPKNFLSSFQPRHVVNDNQDIDAQNVWDVGTYSYADFFINWMVTRGKPHHSFSLNEITSSWILELETHQMHLKTLNEIKIDLDKQEVEKVKKSNWILFWR